MTFQAPGSFAERIAHHLAERIARGEPQACERTRRQKVRQAFERRGAGVAEPIPPLPAAAGALRMAIHAA